MAIAKKQGVNRATASARSRSSHAEPSSNYEQIKEEVLTLLTGQVIGKKEAIDYGVLFKRVAVILVATYGITRVGMLRQLAFSIATSFVTRWLVMKAADSFLPELHPAKA
jgi:hypothetical protein